MDLRFIDLFAGCGGLSLGLRRAGWTPTFAVEAHPEAFETYRHNHMREAHSWPSWLPVGPLKVEDLIANHGERLAGLAGTVALVAGGPPCQGFSTAGRRKADDPRNALVNQYLRFLDLVQPELVLFENVRGFTTMAHRDAETYAEYVSAELGRRGYRVWSELLCASGWGVPQRRPRYFAIASRGATAGIDPFLRMRVRRKGFLRDRGLPADKPVTAAEALADLRSAGVALTDCPDGGVAGFNQIAYSAPGKPSGYLALMRAGAAGPPDGLRLPRHTEAVRSRFEEVLRTCKPGRFLGAQDRQRLGMLKRSFTPLDADQPACTVTTLPDDMLHYSEPRILTVRECARLQSFPDWFEFRGPYTSGGPQRSKACPRYTQVGNAVPPLLAEALGEVLATLLPKLPEFAGQADEVLEVTS